MLGLPLLQRCMSLRAIFILCTALGVVNLGLTGLLAVPPLRQAYYAPFGVAAMGVLNQIPTPMIRACVTQHFGQAKYGLSLAAVAAVQTLFVLIGNQLSPRLYSATVHIGHPEFTFYAATALGFIVFVAAAMLPALDPRVPLAPGVADAEGKESKEEQEDLVQEQELVVGIQ
eukprot:SAG22_NODE_1467_length_4349_cov_3.654353_5_plen_172_part_00